MKERESARRPEAVHDKHRRVSAATEAQGRIGVAEDEVDEPASPVKCEPPCCRQRLAPEVHPVLLSGMATAAATTRKHESAKDELGMCVEPP